MRKTRKNACKLANRPKFHLQINGQNYATLFFTIAMTTNFIHFCQKMAFVKISGSSCYSTGVIFKNKNTRKSGRNARTKKNKENVGGEKNEN